MFSCLFHFPHPLYLFLLLPSLLLVAGVAVAQRVVTVQAGPLIRTEGSHVTIWCNVTGYKQGTVQDFEWSMYLPSAPDREIRIVSTAQPNYAYAVYTQRVNSKEIYVERLSRDSAVLHITKVQANDQGLFECYTPNTDGRYLGSYSARTNLTGKPPCTYTCRFTMNPHLVTQTEHTHPHTWVSCETPVWCRERRQILCKMMFGPVKSSPSPNKDIVLVHVVGRNTAFCVQDGIYITINWVHGREIYHSTFERRL